MLLKYPTTASHTYITDTYSRRDISMIKKVKSPFPSKKVPASSPNPNLFFDK